MKTVAGDEKFVVAVEHQNVAGRFCPDKSVQVENSAFCAVAEENLPGWKIWAKNDVSPVSDMRKNSPF